MINLLNANYRRRKFVERHKRQSKWSAERRRAEYEKRRTRVSKAGASPEAWRSIVSRSFRTRYGIEIDDYDRMFVDQGGVCALCGAAPSNGRRLCVDHHHGSGAVRGLLCVPCNAHLSVFDDPKKLARFIRYAEPDFSAILDDADG